ncbi:MAG TPA: NAD(P)/FAD-dependent oxidoreductase, partial [Terrimicrobiaceae bacterium]|nr:NAD(P)/FAD-dependent oxidoreductase [Terrimicrobiaceae bacterium]
QSRLKHMETSSSSEEKASLPVVVIIGGGFGGISAAKKLAHAPVRVIVIDRSNHYLFQPLLYQVATAGLSPADIAQPIRAILRGQENVTVVLDEVTEIRPDAREVVTSDITFSYDHLIVAAGARHHYFGNDDWERLAPGLKSLADAVEIRRRVLIAFEVAEKARTAEERHQAMTFVVVGAGPTGVEMAGAISELARFTLRKDFRRIDPADARVILVEAGPRVLPTFAPELSESGLRQLQNLHVEVRLNSAVTRLADGEVDINEEVIRTRTVVWAAGNKASPLASMLGGSVDKQGRVKVNADLTIPGRPEIQAIGDMIAATFDGGKPVPGVSPAAMQAGAHAAGNILRQLRGEKPAEWKYFDKGSMATIGRNAAVAQIALFKFSGFLAWCAWVFVHLLFLMGFRNRSAVFLQWVWAYFTYGKGARLISGPVGTWGILGRPGRTQHPARPPESSGEPKR